MLRVRHLLAFSLFATAMRADLLTAQPSVAPYAAVELSPAQLSADVALLRQAIQQVHAGYSRYLPPRVLDSAFARLARRTATPMTDVALYHDVAMLLAKIRCNHTKAEYPDALTEYREQTATHLPVLVRIFGKRIIVAKSASAALVRGDEIVGINGIAAADVIARLSPYVAVDGFTDFTRSTLLERDGDLMGSDLDQYWPVEFGFASQWSFVLRSPAERVRVVRASPLTFASWKVLAGETAPIDFRNGTTWTMLDDSTASLTIRSFVNYRAPVPPDSLYRTIFLQLRTRHVSHLIIDLRANGGGSDEASDALLRFLSDTAVTPIRRVRRRTIRVDSTLASAFETWGDRAPIFAPSPSWFDTDSVGWFVERFHAKPIAPDSLVFRGRVSMLVGKHNASSATMLLAVLQELGARTGRIRLVGEETGGSAEGPTAGQILFLRLPNSKIKVRIPLKRSDVNVTTFVPGFGLFPDIDATESLSDFRRCIDRALLTARTAPWYAPSSPLAPTVGLMRGLLTYKDYSDGSRVELPTWQHIAPIGTSGAFRQRTIYDDGPGNTIYSTDVLHVIGNQWMEGTGGEDAQESSGRTTLHIVSRRVTGTTQQLVLRGRGRDDNQPVEFRYTVTLGDTISNRLKEFRLPGKAWEFRHTYHLSREKQ